MDISTNGSLVTPTPPSVCDYLGPYPPVITLQCSVKWSQVDMARGNRRGPSKIDRPIICLFMRLYLYIYWKESLTSHAIMSSYPLEGFTQHMTNSSTGWSKFADGLWNNGPPSLASKLRWRLRISDEEPSFNLWYKPYHGMTIAVPLSKTKCRKNVKKFRKLAKCNETPLKSGKLLISFCFYLSNGFYLIRILCTSLFHGLNHDYFWWKTNDKFYPVHDAKLIQIQPMWSTWTYPSGFLI